jgi:hypothetical protein
MALAALDLPSSCSIPITFSPTARGSCTGTLTVSDSAASRQTFLGQTIRTSSPVQTLTFSKRASSTLNLSNIQIAGD